MRRLGLQHSLWYSVPANCRPLDVQKVMHACAVMVPEAVAAWLSVRPTSLCRSRYLLDLALERADADSRLLLHIASLVSPPRRRIGGRGKSPDEAGVGDGSQGREHREGALVSSPHAG